MYLDVIVFLKSRYLYVSIKMPVLRLESLKYSGVCNRLIACVIVSSETLNSGTPKTYT